MDKIAVLIPCYNESRTIEKVVEDFRRVLPEATVYVYDNNSTDGTGRIAACAGAVVRQEFRQGKGNVIRRMFREIDAECYIMADGDDTYPAEDAREMANMVLEKKVDMVVGDRLSSDYFTENKRPFHNFGNMFVRKSINFLFHTDIKDIMTGYRAFSYEFAKNAPEKSHGLVSAEQAHNGADYLKPIGICIQLRLAPFWPVPVFHHEVFHEHIFFHCMDAHFRFNFKALGQHREGFGKFIAEGTVSRHNACSALTSPWDFSGALRRHCFSYLLFFSCRFWIRT